MRRELRRKGESGAQGVDRVRGRGPSPPSPAQRGALLLRAMADNKVQSEAEGVSLADVCVELPPDPVGHPCVSQSPLAFFLACTLLAAVLAVCSWVVVTDTQRRTRNV